jgi:predicted nicotinamide N-methyase
MQVYMRGEHEAAMRDAACTVRRLSFNCTGKRLTLRSIESAQLGGYFGVLWDCGAVMASYLAANPHLVRG